MPVLSAAATVDFFIDITANHRWLMRLATVIIGLRFVYNKITKAPAPIRHVPQAGFFPLLYAIVKEKPIEETARKITLPAAVKCDHGLYTRFDYLGWAIRITRPEAAKALLMADANDVFPKASTALDTRRGTLAARFLLGPNILLMNGDQWKEQRKILNPAFHRSMPVRIFYRVSQKLLDVIEKETSGGAPIDIHDFAQRWALDVLGESAFGFEFHALDDHNNEWVTRYNNAIRSAQKPLYFLFPSIERRFKTWIPERRKAHEEFSIFSNMMSSIVEKRREALKNKNKIVDVSTNSIAVGEKDQEKDLLTLMIEAENDGQGCLSNEELQSNLSMFFLAGHETTASAVCFAIYYLAVHPDIQRCARQEAIRVLGDRCDDLLTIEQTRELVYLNMIIKETLRLQPPAVRIVAREAAKDTEISGVFIPKGTRVAIDIFELHRNPKVWKNPNQFDPGRFAPGGEAEHISRNGMPYTPFSSGSRQCIGMNFSLMEQRVLLSMLLRKFEWHLPENSMHKEKVVTRGRGVIKPVDLMVLFKKRF